MSMVVSFAEDETQAQQLAEAMELSYGPISSRHFPDGETLVQVPEDLPPTTVFYISLNRPDSKLIPMILAADALRRHGAQRVILLAPYLCYMRQDMEFIPGEAVSQKIIGKLLSQYMDVVLTVDSHLHRISHLSEAIPLGDHAINLSATQALGDYLLQKDWHNPILVGPDEESQQWVAAIAEHCGFEYVVARKTRYGDRDVKVDIPIDRLQHATAVMVDDMISSGHTMMQTAKQLTAAGADEVYAICTHALFNQQTELLMRDAGIRQIISSDSIPHESSHIPLTQLWQQALWPLLHEGTMHG